MKRAEFESMLEELGKDHNWDWVRLMFAKDYPLPMIAKDVAYHCWLHKVGEGARIHELRYQLEHLDRHGHFDFQDEQDTRK